MATEYLAEALPSGRAKVNPPGAVIPRRKAEEMKT
jgi:hypothetical protein